MQEYVASHDQHLWNDRREENVIVNSDHSVIRSDYRMTLLMKV